MDGSVTSDVSIQQLADKVAADVLAVIIKQLAYARFLRENRHLTKDQWDARSQVLTGFCYIRGIWIILVEELPHVPVLTTFLPAPPPPPHPASAEHEYQDDYHNKERR